jgi:hypothetical protein
VAQCRFGGSFLACSGFLLSLKGIGERKKQSCVENSTDGRSSGMRWATGNVTSTSMFPIAHTT